MARCPFATWHPISGSSGPHLGGPYKIVHHTTEGSSAEGAMQSFAAHRSDPHFTVDATRIFQHIDTAEGARALRNDEGGVQTNRDSAVQIELVGFAHLPKDPAALANVARLCRWIEETHGVPRRWPAGPTPVARKGRDPGGHKRDAGTWDNEGGHYGHCHVPENTHWDPGYTEEEIAYLMAATFDADGTPSGAPAPRARALSAKAAKTPGKGAAKRRALEDATSTMSDHGIVAVGVTAYLRDLALSAQPALPPGTAAGLRMKALASPARRRAPATQAAGDEAKVNAGSVLSFVDGVSQQEKLDVLYSVQLAQRGASGAFDRFTQTQFWYQKYVEILENLGWTSEQMAFTHYDQREGEFRMDEAAVAIISAIATQSQLTALKSSLTALSRLAEDDGTIRLFDYHASLDGNGNYQLGSVQRSANGALSMALGAFHFRSTDARRRFLFWKWGSRELHLWTAAQRMTLNTDFYARRRDEVLRRLDADASDYIGDLTLGKR